MYIDIESLNFWRELKNSEMKFIRSEKFDEAREDTVKSS